MSRGRTELAQYKRQLELDHACGLMFKLTREHLAPRLRPDEPSSRAGPGKMPDFVFDDGQGGEYVVEVTRLLGPTLRRVYSFAGRSICDRLTDVLDAQYTLEIPFDALPPGGIGVDDAALIVAEVKRRSNSGALPARFEPIPGYVVKKIGTAGRWMSPSVVAHDLPAEVAVDDPRALRLETDFRLVVREAAEKFDSYLRATGASSARCILLLDISETGLDAEYHAGNLGGIESLTFRWAQGLPDDVASVGAIYLEPGVPVWTTPDSDPPMRIRAGTIYADQPRGFLVRLRPPPLQWV